MNILDQIIADKHLEVARRRTQCPEAMLQQQSGFSRTPVSMRQSVLDPAKTGIIAEFKRQSPSKGLINTTADVAQVAAGYAQYGASGISVLTDEKYFGGCTADLEAARTVTNLPIIRKDFVIDEYQVVEARAMGADVILLIAACLSPARVRQLAAFAHTLGLEVLLELHAAEELAHVCPEADMIGINNRNLKNFEVNLDHSIQLADKLPAGSTTIAESGIHSVDSLLYLKAHGFKGFLMGEYFMKQADPAAAFAAFCRDLRENKKASHP